MLLGIMGSTSAQLPAPSFYHLKRDYELYSAFYRLPLEDQNGFIWFGSATGGGLYRFDGYDLLNFHVDPNNKATTIATDLILSIYFAPDSFLYAGTILGFTRLDMTTGKLKNYHTFYDSLPVPEAGTILSFLLDSLHQKLWMGTGYGLMHMDLGTEKITMLHPSAPVDQMMPDDILQIYRDSLQPGVLWLIANNGLFTYTISSNQYKLIPIPGTPDSVITCGIKEKNSAAMWLATNADFITRFHPPSNTWKNYPIKTKDGIPDHWYAIHPIDTIECWLTGQSNVGRLNLQTGDFDSWQFQKEYPDGLLHHGVYFGALNDRHGRLWVANFQGIQYARQAFVPKSQTVKDLRVRIIGVDIVPVLNEKHSSLLYKGTLELLKDQRDLTLHYVLPNPLDIADVTYQYKLEGYDKDWITSDQRTVRYGKLHGGQYVFKIKGREGKNGQWTPENTLVISIPKKLSEVIWFWVALAIAALLIAYALFRYLVSNAQKKAKMKAEFEHQLSEVQMQALRAQMNPHFLFNSLNSIKYFAISKSKDETADYLSKFALLVRTILTNSKSKTISLQQELDALRLYIEIEHLRLEGKFDYKIDIDSSIHVRQTQIPPMILQPFVENAIWHGLMHKDGKGFLHVQVQDMGRHIQCVIEDNGVGRARSAEMRKKQVEHRKSEGMQITADRIALINRIYNIHTEVDVIDLQNADGSPAGTRVVIHIPLIRDEEE
jgi:hypothetical protein